MLSRTGLIEAENRAANPVNVGAASQKQRVLLAGG
jgi:hypothetical protein